MKKLFLTLFISLFALSASAQVKFSGGSKFTGGTLTRNLTMSDGTIVELATGSAANLSLRFRGDTGTGFLGSSNQIDFYTGGSRRFYLYNGGLLLEVPMTAPANATGAFYIPSSLTTDRAIYTWKMSGGTVRNVGLGPESAGSGQPAMYTWDGAALDKAQVWASDSTSISVNVGIGTSTPDCALQNQGFSRLGDSAPALKCKLITGTTPSVVASASFVAHGLTATKIVSLSPLLTTFNGADGVPEGYKDANMFYNVSFSETVSSGTLILETGPAATSVLSKTVRILVWYTE